MEITETLNIDAVYENGQIRTLEPVQLEEGQSIQLIIKKTRELTEDELKASLERLHALLNEEAYEGEQAETLEYLMKALDEDRL